MPHRRDFCKALVIAPAVTAAPMLMRSAFADEVSSIVMVSQHGLPYLPLMVMDTLGLVQKHAGKLGIPSLKPDYKILGGTQSLIDALLSRQMDFGVRPAGQAWPRYGTRPLARSTKCARCPPCSRCHSCW